MFNLMMINSKNYLILIHYFVQYILKNVKSGTAHINILEQHFSSSLPGHTFGFESVYSKENY